MLFIGALRLVKGVKELLEAYERLQDPPPLVLIGTSLPRIERLYEELVRPRATDPS